MYEKFCQFNYCYFFAYLKKKQYLCRRNAVAAKLLVMEKPYIYQDDTISFVTVAAQTCLVLEHTAEMERDEFIEKILCALPLLYVKTHMLAMPEEMLDGEPQRFVQEDDYNYIRQGVKNLLGTDDAYLEVFLDDMRYNDEPITAYISEHLADIYQELKDMAANFQTGNEAVMNDAIRACLLAFREHWGQKLVDVMRPLHAMKLTIDN